ncbi:MAG: rhodanese-like domain-containing protein [Halobacteriovoraceae bacterium]|nr:rhodanese-like domain-containing protein [Halobacteriovoraceae bacterium]MCB9095184.1 rhodanese-like domain-containing protein [Halobacteriovoraceae bacterium]
MHTINASDVKSFVDVPERGVLIDVLSKESYNKEHIPNSRNIPADDKEFIDRAKVLVGDMQKPVVVYCASTTCHASDEAAQRLEEAGFENVYDFAGGLEEWKNSQYEIESH